MRQAIDEMIEGMHAIEGKWCEFVQQLRSMPDQEFIALVVRNATTPPLVNRVIELQRTFLQLADLTAATAAIVNRRAGRIVSGGDNAQPGP